MIAKKYEPPKVPMPSRDGAGSFTFKEGTGPIISVVSFGNFLEMYKADATSQLRSPEDIDPQRTNPNAPWVSTVNTRAGSANEIVSRLVIQSSELLKSVQLPDGVDKDKVLRHMHKVKEDLLQCEQIALRVNAAVMEITGKIERNELPRDNHGRGFNPFPQVADLHHEANNFLISANKVVRAICGIPRLFAALKEDSNFDHLSKTLAAALSQDSTLVQFVVEQAVLVRRIVELRNHAEHTREESKRTEIYNFRVLPNGQIGLPVWGIVDRDNVEQVYVHEEMQEITTYLRYVAEGTFILSLEQYRAASFPIILSAVEKPRSECPVHYAYVPDMTKIKFVPSTSSPQAECSNVHGGPITSNEGSALSR